MPRWSAFLALALFAAACRAPGQGGTAPSPSIPLVTATVPPADHAMCDVLALEQVTSIAGQPAAIDPELSKVGTCTYAIGGASAGVSYQITLRDEDVFEDLATAKHAFADGRDVPDLADGAYWSPTVDVMWFQVGDRLFAVQLLGFDHARDDAMGFARAIAEAALAKLGALGADLEPPVRDAAKEPTA